MFFLSWKNKKNKLLGLILLDEIRPIVFSQFKVKYTSTNEVMQPPKEIIFYDETLETIMEKFDTSGCKVLPVLKRWHLPWIYIQTTYS